MRPHRSSITRKFGALYALLFVLISGLGVLVIWQDREAGRDAEILLEETRELVLVRDARDRLAQLRPLVARDAREGSDAGRRDASLRLLERIGASLTAITHSSDDPSRETHQDREDALILDLEVELAELEQRIDTGGAPTQEELATIDRAVDGLGALIDETRTEYELAGEHLERARDRTARITWITVIASLAVLGASSVLVLRGVVEPVRRLRDGAERIGRGELDHRIRISNTDELGELARSFNDMADRVAGARAVLEQQVLDRTREFIRAARLADLGMLAAGVAHEINNPLASIAACAEGLQRRAENGRLDADDVRESLEIVRTESARAKRITARLLELARQDQEELSEFELGLAMDHVAKAAKYVLDRKGVRLSVTIEDPETRVFGNAGELTQICMNLLSNAKDASGAGGIVELDCRVERERLVVRVRDRGHGIRAEDRERIFEPFFTTKEPGRGTGLGLALVEAMVTARNGEVSAAERDGGGTEFRVDLPLRWRAA